jgi:hypothetical protein
MFDDKMHPNLFSLFLAVIEQKKSSTNSANNCHFSVLIVSDSALSSNFGRIFSTHLGSQKCLPCRSVDLGIKLRLVLVKGFPRRSSISCRRQHVRQMPDEILKILDLRLHY